MDFKKIAIISALAIGAGACATAQQSQPRPSMTATECGDVGGTGKLCVRYLDGAEERYFLGTRDDKTKFCGLRMTQADNSYTLLKDDGCDNTVDAYIKGKGKSELEKITRSEKTKWFEEELDTLLLKKKGEMLK